MEKQKHRRKDDPALEATVTQAFQLCGWIATRTDKGASSFVLWCNLYRWWTTTPGRRAGGGRKKRRDRGTERRDERTGEQGPSSRRQGRAKVYIRATSASSPGPQDHCRQGRESTGATKNPPTPGPQVPRHRNGGRKSNVATTGPQAQRRRDWQWYPPAEPAIPGCRILITRTCARTAVHDDDMNMNMNAIFITGYYGQKVKDVQERHATTRKRDLLQRAKRDMLQFAKETYYNV
ncbi:hypothetical protein FIBSPDRAFT_887865 [Athelia psychrophila]|uniref:Uncharacterized protein n=1 Tax=Athelia psychrophila TaxID=1759441 RepID=A0A166P1J1_9AGAM|nr:hypothetical protein FIBSPDRAFT_887865 [Fibularhizoctonia sp. CBS 109695]